jgi:predicted DNA-binding transcriptional regulator YafY
MGSVTGIEEAALRALTKIEQVLPSRLRRRVKALGDAVSPLYFGSTRVDATRLSVIAGASRDFERAAFRYSDTLGRITERLVEPHGLVHTGSRWYLVAWDETREDWRTFRVDRIEGDVKLRGPFSPRPLPEGDLARYVARSFTEHAYTHVARVIFHAPIERLRSRIAPTVGRLEPVDANRCRLVSGAHTLEVLALHVALLGEDFVIEEPPELVETARALSKRLAHAAGTKREGSKREASEREVPKRAASKREASEREVPKRATSKREASRREGPKHAAWKA